MPPATRYTLFLISALLGLSGAAYLALGLDQLDYGEAVIARVNGVPITQTEYIRALTAMQAGLKRSLTEQDKARAVKVLIDEEVILQHALDIGLARTDLVARKNLIQALIRANRLLGQAADNEVDEEILQAFYEQEKLLFSASLMLTVAAVKTDSRTQANAFRDDILGGMDFYAAGEKNGLTNMTVPAAIPLGKVADYLGGEARDALVTLEQDSIAGPLINGDGFIFIWLQKKTGGVSDYETIAAQVKSEWQRRQDEQDFANYLAGLKRTARIKTYPDNIVNLPAAE